MGIPHLSRAERRKKENYWNKVSGLCFSVDNIPKMVFWRFLEFLMVKGNVLKN